MDKQQQFTENKCKQILWQMKECAKDLRAAGQERKAVVFDNHVVLMENALFLIDETEGQGE